MPFLFFPWTGKVTTGSPLSRLHISMPLPPEIPPLATPPAPPRRKKRAPFSPRRLFRRLVLYALVYGAVLVAVYVLAYPLARCLHLRHAIKDALASATQVRVVEHSNAFDPPVVSPEQFHEKVYTTLTLTPGQIADLRRALPISLDFSKHYVTFCAFVDHHRIEAVQPDGSVFAVDLCFQCGELRLGDGLVRHLPLRWRHTLSGYFTALGLHPDGPWPLRE